jgi:hypothetical protein
VRRDPEGSIFTSRVAYAEVHAALIGDPFEFWASDERLEAAARRERLTVVNPARAG